MAGVLEGFAVIAVLVAVGALAAQVGVIDAAGGRALARVVFFIATPALLLDLLSRSDPVSVFSSSLIGAVTSVVVVSTAYALVARFVLHRESGHLVIGMLCSSYVNAANLGIPIAVYVLDDATYIAPVLLMQLVLLSPLAFGALGAITSGHRPAPHVLLLYGVRNPLTLAAVAGLALAIAGWPIPSAVADPLALLGGMSVPGMLIAYGVSLRLGPRIGASGSAGEVALVTVLKLVVQPALAYLLGRLVLGLEGNDLLALTVLAALPTAQNIFVYATRYDRATLLARDAIAASTLLAVPAMLTITALIG
ncbi:MAG: AEC family transporter [Nocardioidaceae bacterium]|nr:AEC family transporter [Nocardioidaceae bacterium]